jgi:RNA polymerase sigma-70 factor, ECF subfamily
MQQLNEQNFEAVFKQYYSPLCNISFSIVKDRDAAEDVIQELFTSLWKNKEQLNIKEDIKNYLFRAARNRSLNYLRDKKSHEDIETSGVEAKMAENNPQSQMEHFELMESIQNVVNSLPDKCREVFLLSRYEKKSYKEIAIVLNISEKTVENHISKALKILREKLKIAANGRMAVILLLLLKIFQGQ